MSERETTMATHLNWQEKVENILEQVQYHFTPTRIATIKKTDNNVLTGWLSWSGQRPIY